MSIEEQGFKLELSLDFNDGELESAVGSLVTHSENNDEFAQTTVHFAAIVETVKFSRLEALGRLYAAAGNAGRVFGVDSEEFADLESDIEDVKAGGPLAQYAWLFE